MFPGSLSLRLLHNAHQQRVAGPRRLSGVDIFVMAGVNGGSALIVLLCLLCVGSVALARAVFRIFGTFQCCHIWSWACARLGHAVGGSCEPVESSILVRLDEGCLFRGYYGDALCSQAIQDVPGIIVGLILVKAAFDNVLSDYLWVRAIMLLSPTIATIGERHVVALVVGVS